MCIKERRGRAGREGRTRPRAAALVASPGTGGRRRGRSRTCVSRARARAGAGAGAALPQISNGVTTLTFDAGSGLLAGYASSAAGGLPAAALQQTLLYYASNTGDAVDGATSGAYVFRPNASQAAFPVADAARGYHTARTSERMRRVS